MQNKVAPCKGCEDRNTGCHDRCARYAEFKANLQKVKDLEKEYKRSCREEWRRSEECESKIENWRLSKKYGR